MPSPLSLDPTLGSKNIMARAINKGGCLQRLCGRETHVHARCLWKVPRERLRERAF